MEVVEPEVYMTRFCNHLKLPAHVQVAFLPFLQYFAEHVARNIQRSGIGGGRAPTTIAACAIYFVTMISDDKNKRTVRDIGEVAGLSEGTIRQAYKKCYDHRHSLVTEDLLRGHSLDELPVV